MCRSCKLLATGLVALVLLAAAPVAAQGKTQPLFHIERSKNANIVRYDAQLTADGKLDQREPVIAYWIMLAEDGHREELSWIEKKKAYGFTIKADPAAAGFMLTLVAAPERVITVRMEGDRARAELVIDGQPAIFTKMYIKSTEGLLGPKVDYIELFGKDLKTGKDRHEKLVPK
ncbi:MAG: DUF4833 domain-containing protein [Deltaproteobacteria bacterium]|nr:DUF4833 domain-containing protein [Deltaproteobacteria bacterium]